MQMGCVSSKLAASLTEEESIRSTHSDDCFLHATADRNTAVCYAYGAYGIGNGSVLQVSVPAVVASYGAEVVRPVCTKSERVELNIAEDGRAAFFARKDFETLLVVWQLSTANGHILAHLDVADLNLGDRLEGSTKPTLTTDEVFLGSSVDGMRKHNMLAAMAFRKTEMYQQNVQDCANRNLLSVSTDGSGLPGEDCGILTKLSRQYEHVGDKHDSTYALGLEATRKATVTSMQATGRWHYK